MTKQKKFAINQLIQRRSDSTKQTKIEAIMDLWVAQLPELERVSKLIELTAIIALQHKAKREETSA